MGKTREIKKRIKAVGNIRRITKTMQMIATAKFSAAQGRAVAAKPYTEAIFDLVTSLAAGLDDLSHPLLGGAPTSGSGKSGPAPEITLVLTSDRGLCGPYNGAVLRTGMHLFRSNPTARAGQIELVGKKGLGALKFNQIPVAKHHTQFGDKPSYEAVEALAQNYIDRFSTGEISVVRVIYMRFISAGKQAPTVTQLLPFQAPTLTTGLHTDAKGGQAAAAPAATGPKYNQVYEFSPDAKTLLDDLLPAAIKAVLFQIFQDAVVSEHVSRMIAMKSATDNAGKMGKRLTRSFNRARQAQITTELTEIISGAAALK